MDWIQISLQLLGGLAIFLYGMWIASDGLKQSASNHLKVFLQKVTKNQFYGAIAGIVLAAVMQSSTAATVMTVGFVNAGLISLRRALGIMLGSAVGTTITVQLIAFSITDYALAFVTLGVLLFLMNVKMRAYGSIVLGFGFVFFGMGIMTAAMEPLQTDPVFMEYLAAISEQPLLAVVVAALFTAIVQNSAATIALAMALAANGSISLEAGVAIVYGANFGTVFTALISSVTASKDAQRAAVAHAIFKGIGVLIFLPLTSVFVAILPLFGGEIERQIANSHTLFNLVNLFILLPFCDRFAVWMTKLMPKKELPSKYVKHLDRDASAIPAVGLLQARKELEVVTERVSEHMFPHLLSMIEDDKARQQVVQQERIIDVVYKATYHHLQRIMENNLNDKESEEALKLLYVNNDLERLTNVMKEMARAMNKLENKHKMLNDWEREKIQQLFEEVEQGFSHASKAFSNNREEEALQVIYNNPKIQRMEREMRYEHFYYGSGSSSTVSVVFSDLMNLMLRIHQHSVNMSHTMLGMV
ncbi:Na/Pi cotransporter family protein [Geomicrobium sp. JSM 1781026]|uniref:Na/Pi cotransporter family protein n=1 Tax=Geomicrobium sp. JSM 1781026 TaxID=3344580 RepID=UPI0035BF5BFA